jgi:tRNA(fMet)-specific endonuclease VapC
MNRNFLLDTNIISESIKRQPDETFLDNFRQNLEDSAIVSVTWHELLDGLYRLPESRRRPSYPDGQIATIARVNHLILVTRNVSDFVDFEEPTIENWFV